MLLSASCALILAIVALYSARVQSIRLYSDDPSACVTSEVSFGLLASTAGGLIAIGFDSGVNLVT